MIEDKNQFNYRPKIQVKKDYYRQRFINPYFNKDKKNKYQGFNTRFYLKILVAVFLLYLIVYSDLFKIGEISISGTDMISQTEFRQMVEKEINTWRWHFWPQRNQLLLSKKRLAQKITSQYSLSKLEIKKGWRRLQINLEEKISYLMVFNRGKFYFTDAWGNVTREISPEEAQKYWTRFPILNTDQERVDIGSQITSEKMVNFILALSGKIKEMKLAISGYESRGQEEVSLVAKAGWRAYFDIDSDVAKSVENLELVLKEKIKDQKNLQYIDLRFGDKIYYK
ncbi:MAG: hypothetical protein WC518_02000 [Patescibacteria group bacterium]